MRLSLNPTRWLREYGSRRSIALQTVNVLVQPLRHFLRRSLMIGDTQGVEPLLRKMNEMAFSSRVRQRS